ncbi:MAG: MFS transporter [Pirellulales bacterium]
MVSRARRSAAVGFYTLGATLGASIAPWIVIHLAKQHWQMAFIATGMMGLVWIPVWALIYRSPKKHPLITQKDLDVLLAQESTSVQEAGPQISELRRGGRVPSIKTVLILILNEIRRWGMALSIKAVWILMIARMLTDCVWYFYQQWYASYLFSERSVSQTGLAITGMLFFAADVGAILGGLSSFFIGKRVRSSPLSRLMTMLVCALLMFLSPLVSKVDSVHSSVAIACVIAFAHMAWLVNITALTVDLIPKHLLATCFGITAAGGASGRDFHE